MSLMVSNRSGERSFSKIALNQIKALQNNDNHLMAMELLSKENDDDIFSTSFEDIIDNFYWQVATTKSRTEFVTQ